MFKLNSKITYFCVKSNLVLHLPCFFFKKNLFYFKPTNFEKQNKNFRWTMTILNYSPFKKPFNIEQY